MVKKAEEKVVFTADAKPVFAVIKDLKRRQEALNKKLTAMAGIAKKALIAMGLPLGLATREFEKFEYQITRAGLAMSATAKEQKALAKEARIVGATTQKTATDAAAALETYALAGFNAKESILLLRAAVNQAVIANQDTVQSAQQISKIYKIFGGDINDVGGYVDKLTYLQSNLMVTTGELAQHMGYAGGMAKQLGFDFTSTATAAGILNETQGPRAGVALNALFTALGKNVGKLKEYNISVFDSAGETRSLVDILRDFESAMKNKTKEEQLAVTSTLGNVRAKRALNGMLAFGVTKYENLARATNKSEGTVERWTKKLQGTLKGVRLAFISALQEVGIGTIEAFAESMKAGIIKATKFLRYLGENVDKVVKAIEIGFRFTAALIGLTLLGKSIMIVRGGIALLTTTFKIGRLPAAAFWGAATLGIGFLIAYMPEVIGFFWRFVEVLKSVLKFVKWWAEAFYLPYKLAIMQIKRGFDVMWQTITHGMSVGIGWAKKKFMEFQLTVKERILSLIETWNKLSGFLGADIDTTGIIAGIERIKKAIADIDDHADLTIDTTEADAEIDRVTARIYKLHENMKGMILGALGYTTDDPGSGPQMPGLPPVGKTPIEEEITDYVVPEDGDDEQTPEADELDESGFRSKNRAEQQEFLTAKLELWREYLDGKAEIFDEARQKEFDEARKQEEAMQVLQDKSAKLSDKAKAAMNTIQYKRAQSMQNTLIALEKNGITQFKSLRKAMVLADLALALATKPAEAFAQTSAAFPFPIGPALGAAHAALLVLQLTSAASKAAGFAQGGPVVGGIPGRDSVPAMLTPGELVVPAQNFDEVVSATSGARDGDSDGQPIEINMTIELDGEVVGRKAVSYIAKEGVTF